MACASQSNDLWGSGSRWTCTVHPQITGNSISCTWMSWFRFQGTPIILSMGWNSVSPMWHNNIAQHTSFNRAIRRREVLSKTTFLMYRLYIHLTAVGYIGVAKVNVTARSWMSVMLVTTLPLTSCWLIWMWIFELSAIVDRSNKLSKFVLSFSSEEPRTDDSKAYHA